MTYDSEIKQIVDAVQVHSPTQYSINGQLRNIPQLQQPFASPSVKTADTHAMEEPRGAQMLMPYLENELYSKFYIKPTEGNNSNTYIWQARDFMNELSRANNGTGTWESGWKIVSVEDSGRIKVTKDNIIFWVDMTGILTKKKNIRPGDFCRIRIAKEMRQLVPGFYMAIGNGDINNQRDTMKNLVRLYWNLTSEIAPTYMRLVTERLNAGSLPFRTKVLSDPRSYTRADAGVLYIEKVYFTRIRNAVNDIYNQIKDHLKPEVPMFTKRLYDGLGLAEDPGNGMSFGMSRCKILAKSLCNCYEKGYSDMESRMSVFASSFEEEGINPELPYLEPKSQDIYNLC